MTQPPVQRSYGDACMLGAMPSQLPPDSLTWLDGATVVDLLPDWAEQVALVGDAFRAHAAGRAENPPKLGVHPRPNSFLHAMPAYVGSGDHQDGDVTALKWVAAYPGNPARGLPTISGLVVLNDSGTGLPVAVMDAAALTATRTAAVTGVALRHLAPDGWRRVALLGFGTQGRAHAALLAALWPDAEVAAYAGPRGHLGRTEEGVHLVDDARTAVEGADVVITAGPMTPDHERRVDPAWLGARALVLPVDFDAYVGADLVGNAADLVVDDAAQFAHYRSLGRFTDWPEPDRELGRALDEPPRGELRVVCNLGVGIADAVLADAVRRRAAAAGRGTLLPR